MKFDHKMTLQLSDLNFKLLFLEINYPFDFSLYEKNYSDRR